MRPFPSRVPQTRQSFLFVKRRKSTATTESLITTPYLQTRRIGLYARINDNSCLSIRTTSLLLLAALGSVYCSRLIRQRRRPTMELPSLSSRVPFCVPYHQRPFAVPFLLWVFLTRAGAQKNYPER